MRAVLPIMCLLVLSTGCANGYRQFYHPIVPDPRTQPDLELLTSGEKPAVYATGNLDRDALILRTRRYVPVGYSAFNGHGSVKTGHPGSN
jgi:hypothetical protein